MSEESNRLAEEKKLRDQVERHLQERKLKVQDYTAETLAEFNRQNLTKLSGLALEKAGPITVTSPVEAPKALNRKTDPLAAARTIHRIIGYYEELSNLDPQAALAKKPFMDELDRPEPDRIPVIEDSLKIALAKAVSQTALTEIYRAELMVMLSEPPECPEATDFINRAESLKGKKILSSDDIQKIRQEYQYCLSLAQKARQRETVLEAAALTQKYLSQMGYEVLDGAGLGIGQPGYFSAGHPDYRLQGLMSEDGTMTFQFLKVAASRAEAEQPLSDYQKTLDLEKGENFCRIHRKLIKTLEENGLAARSEIIKKPGEGRLAVLIDPKKPQKTKHKAGAPELAKNSGS